MARPLLVAQLVIFLLKFHPLHSSVVCPRQCICTYINVTGLYNVSCLPDAFPGRFPTLTSAILIQGLPKQESIPPGTFKDLPHIKNLTIMNSHIKTILSNSLEGLWHLEYVTLMDCDIKHIHPLAFIHLMNIRHIDIGYNFQLSLQGLGMALNGLPNNTIETLILDGVNNRKTGTVFLKTSFWKFLKHTNISNISLRDNELGLIQAGFSKYISTVENLVLSRNMIIGEYAAFYEIFTLRKLHFLDISDQQILGRHDFPFNTPLLIKGQSASCLSYPPNLEIIIFRNFRSLTFHLSPWHICPENNVRMLDMSFIKAYEVSYIHGLNKLTYLNFMYNKCSKFPATIFFSYFPKLAVGLFGGNIFGPYVNNDTHGILFKENKFLKVLDLSFNEIYHLPGLFLKRLHNINVFNVSGNQLSELNEFYFLRNATYINVSYNSIHHLPRTVLSSFDNVGRRLTLDISFNPLTMSKACCDIQTFITWSRTTSVNLANYDVFMCIQGKTTTQVKSFSRTILENVCPQYHATDIVFTIPAFFLFVVSVVSVALCYRRRYQIRWWCILLKRHIRLRDDSQPPNNQVIMYDAFVAYSGEDVSWVRTHLERELEVRRGYRLCIHQRDFIPGYPIDENIAEAISRSRRIIMVLSRHFQLSEWCDFETSVAERHSRHRGYSTIIPIVFDSFDVNRTTDVLQYILDQHTYIKWSMHRATFWNAVSRALGPHLEHAN